MDLVYIVKHGDENEDLRYSLRSVDKYAPEFDRIIIFGYKPNWVKNVEYVKIKQELRTGWQNARLNFLTACLSEIPSEDFILMNDDFIATKPIKSWHESLSKVKNTFEQQIKEYEETGLSSQYMRAFSEQIEKIRQISRNKDVYNYELHIPMIINKKRFAEMLEIPVVKSIINENIVLYRSWYGNFSGTYFNEIIDDVKLGLKDTDIVDTEWFSVFDKYIGNIEEFPKINNFLIDRFPEKCKYEI